MTLDRVIILIVRIIICASDLPCLLLLLLLLSVWENAKSHVIVNNNIQCCVLYLEYEKQYISYTSPYLFVH